MGAKRENTYENYIYSDSSNSSNAMKMYLKEIEEYKMLSAVEEIELAKKIDESFIGAKEEFSGPTVHFVNNNYDEGNIISQTKVKLSSNETPESLSKKVQEVEKIQLINVLKKFIDSKN